MTRQEIQHRYYENHREQILGYTSAYARAHPALYQEASHRYDVTHRDERREYQRQFREANPELVQARVRESARKERDRLRAIVLRRYGDACACCSSTERLTIDHIGGGGKQHRKAIGASSSTDFRRWLLRMYLPPGYQTLCDVCNKSKKDSAGCRLNHEKVALCPVA